MNYSEQKKQLEKDGFQRFVTVENLMANPSLAPSSKGVYVILRNSKDKPEFLEAGTGGFFKNENPNVTIAELKENWVENSPIMYIGKAGSTEGKATLQSRLKQYMEFGQGKKVGHRGGRYIWQLKDSKQLIVCWKPTIDDPREVEKKMIEHFKSEHGNMRPFANLQD